MPMPMLGTRVHMIKGEQPQPVGPVVGLLLSIITHPSSQVKDEMDEMDRRMTSRIRDHAMGQLLSPPHLRLGHRVLTGECRVLAFIHLFIYLFIISIVLIVS